MKKKPMTCEQAKEAFNEILASLTLEESSKFIHWLLFYQADISPRILKANGAIADMTDWIHETLPVVARDDRRKPKRTPESDSVQQYIFIKQEMAKGRTKGEAIEAARKETKWRLLEYVSILSNYHRVSRDIKAGKLTL